MSGGTALFTTRPSLPRLAMDLQEEVLIVKIWSRLRCLSLELGRPADYYQPFSDNSAYRMSHSSGRPRSQLILEG